MALTPSTPHTVVILLATLNGARFLDAQLDSLVAQTHTDWRLVASDDGSSDQTLTILRDFAAKHPEKVRLAVGPGRGFARHFMHLMQHAPPAPYIALCDQDDVWRPDKLARAVDHLHPVPHTTPALYCARTLITTKDLTPLRVSDHFTKAPDFRNALVQSIGGGNTMVMNQSAHALAAWAAPRCPDPIAHDWWLYQIMSSCGGVVLRDAEPVLFYRQHGGNQIGARQSRWAAIGRALSILGGRWRRWNPISLAALAPVAPKMTPKARQILQDYVGARSGSMLRRLASLRRARVYRQGVVGTAALYLLCALGRL
ncbi:MAG: glycosyltransferase family 2 protein [Primorskyibacter sp.]